MRDIISQIAEGNYRIPTGSLDFSCAKIEIEVSCDCDYEGSFHIYASEGEEIDGYVMSSDLRMECFNNRLEGSDTEIAYHFHGDLCRPGDVVKGSFYIISNRGEYLIPYNVRIVPCELMSSIGPIKNLFGFTNLAKSSWSEAVNLFYSTDFIKIFDGADENFLEIYRALSANTGNEQNVEEFLISANKKQKIEYVSGKRELVINLSAIEFSDDVIEREVEIIRNGWGFTSLNISCESDFLFTERSSLYSDDFNGNICILKVFVDTRKCRKGKHGGKLILSNNFTSLEIAVEVKSSLDYVARKTARSQSNLIIDITRKFIDHELGFCGDSEWFSITGKHVEQLASGDNENVYAKLFQARLLVMERRNSEASWLVDQAAELIEHKQRDGKLAERELAELLAYHWYIAALVKNDKEFTIMAAQKVEAILKKNKDSWQIAVLALGLPTSYTANTFTKWLLLESIYETGSRSPILYVEAAKLLNDNPTVAKSLEGFALQVAFFSARYKFVDSSAFEHILTLVSRVRNYKYVVLKMLEYLYDDYKDKRVLKEICTFLIRGNRTDKTAAHYYSLAVFADIKITNLFEYYIRSIDISTMQDIPLMVLMYFSYQSNLDYERLAYIYHCMIINKDRYVDLYESNRSNMEFFAAEQVQKGNINRDLAAIYDDVLLPETLSRQMAIGMANLLFANWFTCQSDKYTKLYVYQKGCEKNWEYEIKNGACAVSIFGSSCTLVLEDKDGNRYIESASYGLEKLVSSGKYIKTVSDFVWDNERLNLFLVGVGQSAITVTPENVLRFMQLADSTVLLPEVRQDMMILCMSYHSIHQDEEALSLALRKIDMNTLSAKQMDKIFPILLSMGKTEIAEGWIRKYGPYFTSEENIKKLLEKLLTPSIEEHEKFDASISNAAMYVFRAGNPGSLITAFAAQNYVGTSKELRDIWKQMGVYQLSRNAINKRLLAQLLYSGAHLPEKKDIATEYIKNNPDSKMSKAIVVSMAHGFFTGKEKIDEAFTSFIAQEYMKGEPISTICELAFLKYFAYEPTKLDDVTRNIVCKFLKEQIEERVFLGFFKEYLKAGVFDNEKQNAEVMGILEELTDRTIIDYKAKPGCVARIHYMVSREHGDSGTYSAEIMKEVSGGVCFKDFILFFGETLQYYITDENGEDAQLSINGKVQNSDVDGRGRVSRYNLINDMLVSNTMKDYARFDNLLEEYYRREYMNGELFRLV